MKLVISWVHAIAIIPTRLADSMLLSAQLAGALSALSAPPLPSCPSLLLPSPLPPALPPQAGAYTEFEELLGDCRQEGHALVEACLAAQVRGGSAYC